MKITTRKDYVIYLCNDFPCTDVWLDLYSKVGQIGPKWDRYRTFSDQFQEILTLSKKRLLQCLTFPWLFFKFTMERSVDTMKSWLWRWNQTIYSGIKFLQITFFYLLQFLSLNKRSEQKWTGAQPEIYSYKWSLGICRHVL